MHSLTSNPLAADADTKSPARAFSRNGLIHSLAKLGLGNRGEDRQYAIEGRSCQDIKSK
jgi:hypothetical protein